MGVDQKAVISTKKWWVLLSGAPWEVGDGHEPKRVGQSKDLGIGNVQRLERNNKGIEL